MNERIRELESQCWEERKYGPAWFDSTKFAQLIVEEFRTVLADEYRKTPLECCGHFLRADETIAKHFYGVEE